MVFKEKWQWVLGDRREEQTHGFRRILWPSSSIDFIANSERKRDIWAINGEINLDLMSKNFAISLKWNQQLMCVHTRSMNPVDQIDFQHSPTWSIYLNHRRNKLHESWR